MNKRIVLLSVITIFILALSSGTCFSATKPFGNGRFELLPNMVEPRSGHTATLLKDGRVLITGGCIDSNINRPHKVSKLEAYYTDSAEVYDPRTRKFTLIGNMTTARILHASILLNDGRVLITGGDTPKQYSKRSQKEIRNSAEVFDPKTNKFSKIENMHKNFSAHDMTLLNDGRVLISDRSKNPEIFDPKTNKFHVTSECLGNRCSDIVALLDNGNVLFACSPPESGTVSCKSQIFDPVTEKFTYTGDMLYIRLLPTYTKLKDGRVAVFGGMNHKFKCPTEIYMPSEGKFKEAGTQQGAYNIWDQSSILLDSGKVLLVGGTTNFERQFNISFQKTVKYAYLYDSDKDIFIKISDMHYKKGAPTLIKLNDGSVLITGEWERPELYIQNRIKTGDKS